MRAAAQPGCQKPSGVCGFLKFTDVSINDTDIETWVARQNHIHIADSSSFIKEEKKIVVTSRDSLVNNVVLYFSNGCPIFIISS